VQGLIQQQYAVYASHLENLLVYSGLAAHQAVYGTSAGSFPLTSADILQLCEKFEAAKAQHARAAADLRAAMAEQVDLRAKQTDLQVKQGDLQAKLEQSAAEIEILRQRLDAERAMRESMERSKSWRITEPLRRLSAILGTNKV
jgi:uncharacterized protein YlxW (UPF0749 family)